LESRTDRDYSSRRAKIDEEFWRLPKLFIDLCLRSQRPSAANLQIAASSAL